MSDSDKEAKLSPHNLQAVYYAALSGVGGLRRPNNLKRYTPIFQRDSAGSRKQAVKDAASALSALWKVGESSKR